MKRRNTRSSKRKIGVSVYLDDEEVEMLEAKSLKEKLSTSEFIAGLVRNAIYESEQSKLNEIRNEVSQTNARLSKLERIQRTIIFNTAYVRGYAVGSARTTPVESRKTIEQEMVKTFDKQKELFFDLYPEQRDSETKDSRP